GSRCRSAFPTRPRGWFVPAVDAGGGCPEPAMDGRRPDREQDAYFSGWASPSCSRGGRRTIRTKPPFLSYTHVQQRRAGWSDAVRCLPVERRAKRKRAAMRPVFTSHATATPTGIAVSGAGSELRGLAQLLGLVRLFPRKRGRGVGLARGVDVADLLRLAA